MRARWESNTIVRLMAFAQATMVRALHRNCIGIVYKSTLPPGRSDSRHGHAYLRPDTVYNVYRDSSTRQVRNLGGGVEGFPGRVVPTYGSSDSSVR
ncbi:hypothetical protein BKA64DRAFT_678469 [Cadophora sp. MPI-SDFR-AT-0126]|nr:hypothetical protein BKA64DRAFT_678469 [Leotiomycetes sp. MPI-SDFR-AT-0126]